jgi:hypothetical protein
LAAWRRGRMSKLDKTGAVVSLACAIHCAVLPICMTLLPLAGLSFLADTKFDIALLLTSGTIATISGCYGYEVHKKVWVPLLFWLAIVLLFAGVALHSKDEHTGWSGAAMPLGGIILCTTHIMNVRLCKSCRSCHHGGADGHQKEEES